MSHAVRSSVSCYIKNSLYKYCPAGLWNQPIFSNLQEHMQQAKSKFYLW